MKCFIGANGTRKNALENIRSLVSERSEKKFKFIKGTYKVGKTETIREALKKFNGKISRNKINLIIIDVEPESSKKKLLRKISRDIVEKFGELVSSNKRPYRSYFELAKKINEYMENIDKKGDIANIRNNLLDIIDEISKAEPELTIVLIVSSIKNIDFNFIPEFIRIIGNSNLYIIFKIYDDNGLDSILNSTKVNDNDMNVVKNSTNFSFSNDIETIDPFNFDECTKLIQEYNINVEFSKIIEKMSCHPKFLDTFCEKVYNKKNSIDVIKEADDLINYDKDYETYTTDYFKIIEISKPKIIQEYRKIIKKKLNNYIPHKNYCECMEEFGLIYCQNGDNNFKIPILFEEHIKRFKKKKKKEELKMDLFGKNYVEKLINLSLESAATTTWKYIYEKLKKKKNEFSKKEQKDKNAQRTKLFNINWFQIKLLLSDPAFIDKDKMNYIYGEIFDGNSIQNDYPKGTKEDWADYLVTKARSEVDISKFILLLEKYGNLNYLKSTA